MPLLELSEDHALRYEDSGGSGPAVVLAHGFLMNHRSFDAQVAGLPNYRWIRWDLRGHGESRCDEDEYTFWDQARDGLALLDHLGVDRAVFGGHSQGGFTALRMALCAPQRCRGLLLLGTADQPYSPQDQASYRRLFESWQPGTDAGDVIAAALAPSMIGGDIEEQRVWRERWAREHQDRARFISALNCLVEVDDLGELSGTVTAPALFVRGVADQAFSAEQVERSAERLGSSAKVVTIQGHTHGAHMTAPDEVNAVIEEWLTTLDG